MAVRVPSQLIPPHGSFREGKRKALRWGVNARKASYQPQQFNHSRTGHHSIEGDDAGLGLNRSIDVAREDFLFSLFRRKGLNSQSGRVEMPPTPQAWTAWPDDHNTTRIPHDTACGVDPERCAEVDDWEVEGICSAVQ